MKKLLLIFVLLILGGSSLYAATSREFSFTWTVLDSLHFCQWAMDYHIKENDDLAKMMSDSMTANNKFEDAKAIMQKYVNDKDEHMSMVAKGIIAGIDILIDGNNKLIDKMRKASNLDPEGFSDLDYDMAQIKTQNKQGWETLSLASAWVLAVLVEPAKNENPTGALPFKIAKEERANLLKRLDELFEDRLKRYDEYKVLQKQGKQGNPDDQTWLIFAIARIRDTLSCETYEESKARGL